MLSAALSGGLVGTATVTVGGGLVGAAIVLVGVGSSVVDVGVGVGAVAHAATRTTPKIEPTTREMHLDIRRLFNLSTITGL